MTQNNTLLTNDFKDEFEEFEELVNSDKSSSGIYIITMMIAIMFFIMALFSLFYTDLILFWKEIKDDSRKRSETIKDLFWNKL